MAACTEGVTLETLADYFHDALPAAAAEAFEAHLFSCDDCTERLEALAALARGVRRLVRAGQVAFVLTDALRAQLAADGAHLREFHLEPGQRLPCGAAAEDEVVILGLAADLTGVEHATLDVADDAGILTLHHEDIPLVPGDTVRVAYPAQLIRDLPDLTVHIRLSATGGGQSRQLAEYTLLHDHQGPGRL